MSVLKSRGVWLYCPFCSSDSEKHYANRRHVVRLSVFFNPLPFIPGSCILLPTAVSICLHIYNAAVVTDPKLVSVLKQRSSKSKYRF